LLEQHGNFFRICFSIFSYLKKGRGNRNYFGEKNISPNDGNSPQKEKLEEGQWLTTDLLSEFCLFSAWKI
jgi:hypothetical protein